MSAAIDTLDDAVSVYVIRANGRRARMKAIVRLPAEAPIELWQSIARRCYTSDQEQTMIAQFRDQLMKRYGRQLTSLPLPKDAYTTITGLARALEAATARIADLERRLATLEGEST